MKVFERSFELYRQIYQTKSLGTEILFSENRVILASDVLLQYTRVIDNRRRRQPDRRDIMTTAELCNAFATFV